MNKKKFKFLTKTILLMVMLICLAYIQKNIEKKEYEKDQIFNSQLNILFFNVGQAESMLITNKEKAMMIDCGNKSDGKYIVDFLKEQGIDKLDYLIGTHIDEDHIGGMEDILKDINVDTLYMPYCTYDGKQFYTELEEYIRENNINKQNIGMSQINEYQLGDAKWKCLYVDNSNPSDKSKFNDTSIVIQLEFGNTSYLFTGDLTDSIDSKIEGLGKIDVLKVAHHGAKESTSQKFLNIVKPTYAVISAGIDNNYNHPNQKVIDRLIFSGVKKDNIFITKNQGTIWMKSDGKKIDIEERKDIDLDGANRISYRSIFSNMFLFLIVFRIVFIRIWNSSVHISI